MAMFTMGLLATVKALLTARSPSTITWLIVAVIVDAVE